MKKRWRKAAAGGDRSSTLFLSSPVGDATRTLESDGRRSPMVGRSIVAPVGFTRDRYWPVFPLRIVWWVTTFITHIYITISDDLISSDSAQFTSYFL